MREGQDKEVGGPMRDVQAADALVRPWLAQIKAIETAHGDRKARAQAYAMLKAAILYLGPPKAFDAITMEASSLIRASIPANDRSTRRGRVIEAMRNPANAFGLGLGYATIFWLVLHVVLLAMNR